MVKKWVFILIIVAFIAGPISVFGVSNTVVINSFRIRTSAKSTDEYIELYNAGNSDVSLKDWRLKKFTSSGTGYNLLTAFPEIVLLSKQSLIISHKDYGGTSDLYYSTTSSLAEDNSLVLYSDAGKTEVDKVGWGAAKFFETEPLPNPKPDEIWERKENGLDSDDNLTNFQLRTTVEEKATDTSEVETGSQTVDLYITELMPNPEGSDTDNEWAEIYNAGPDINLGGFNISDRMGSIKTFNFQSDLVLENGQYFVLPLKGTGISLNNDGDILEIKDNSGNVVASTGQAYGNAKEGIAWAFDGENWQWTKTPTPGAENIIEKVLTESKTKSSKSKASTVKKSKVPKAEVKGANSDSEDIFAEREENVSEDDKKIGIALIVLALVSGLAYTIYTNWSKIVEVYLAKRKGYYKFRQKIREKVKKG